MFRYTRILYFRATANKLVMHFGSPFLQLIRRFVIPARDITYVRAWTELTAVQQPVTGTHRLLRGHWPAPTKKSPKGRRNPHSPALFLQQTKFGHINEQSATLQELLTRLNQVTDKYNWNWSSLRAQATGDPSISQKQSMFTVSLQELKSRRQYKINFNTKIHTLP
jgi:hypothetical protein